ncbi:MAG: HAMP domain-containing histidine kinase [Leptolyngbya sp. SIO4C1]|nr:HAMP domain-containing histidine kinase [Leptolyngbya sp. SIO4C1]
MDSSLLRETRTRILLLYLVCMSLVTGIAIPIFRWAFLSAVDERVRRDLDEEMADFSQLYQAWHPTVTSPSSAQVIDFVDDFLKTEQPEDDNFLIAYIGDSFHRAIPSALPEELQPNSSIIQQGLGSQIPIRGIVPSDNPEIGKILYRIQPLTFDGQRQGMFIAAHITAGERQEAMVGIYIFALMAAGVTLISGILTWVGMGRLLKPVSTLAHTAQSISESDLSQRLPVLGSGELAELAATFNSMMERIQHAFNSQRNFINDAGHELRTPITIIRGHLELMGDHPAEQQETRALVIDELDRMNRLVDDLMVLAKSERYDFLQLETIQLNLFVEELFSKAKTLAERRWRLSQQGSGHLVADRQRLTGALLNLLTNAAQHTQPPDEIELGYRCQANRVSFWVRDTGAGIAKVDQARVFERFARASDRKRQSEGAGLGLAIVRAIVTAHHGRIQLSSKLGEGSTFTLILPLDQPLEAAAL